MGFKFINQLTTWAWGHHPVDICTFQDWNTMSATLNPILTCATGQKVSKQNVLFQNFRQLRALISPCPPFESGTLQISNFHCIDPPQFSWTISTHCAESTSSLFHVGIHIVWLRPIWAGGLCVVYVSEKLVAHGVYVKIVGPFHSQTVLHFFAGSRRVQDFWI